MVCDGGWRTRKMGTKNVEYKGMIPMFIDSRVNYIIITYCMFIKT